MRPVITGLIQQADSVEFRGMHERMGQDENADETERKPEQSEFQNRERRIGSAEGESEERNGAKSAVRSRYSSAVFSGEMRSRCSVNARLENNLDKHFENKFEDEAEQIFHVAPMAEVF